MARSTLEQWRMFKAVAEHGGFHQAAVSAEYPLIRIELFETILSGANELLEQGKAAIAISPFTLPDNLSEDICQIEFVAVAGAQHPLT